MKKKINFKRIGAVLMAATMSLSMGMTALADEPQAGVPSAAAKTGTLTIQGIKATNEGDIGIPKDGAKYAIYPVLTFQDAQQLSGGGYVYTNITVEDASPFKGIIEAEEYADNGVTKKGIEAISAYATSSASGSQIAQFAAKLEAAANKPALAADFTIGTTSAVTLPYGYYLVVETAAPKDSVGVKSAPMLVAIPQIQGNTLNNDVTVTIKSSTADIKKEIVIDENTSMNVNNGAVGDIVNYRVTSDIPMYGAGVTDFHYVINDKLSKGLTYQNDMKISLHAEGKEPVVLLENNVGVLAGKVSVTDEVDPDKHTAITVTINNLLKEVVSGKEIYKYAEDGKAQFVLEYSAKINADAVQGNGGNENSVNLKYEADHTTEDKVVTTYTTSLLLIKEEQTSTGAATGTPLKGAEFKLSKKNGEVYEQLKDANGDPLVLTTDDNGKLTFPGLSEGEYELEETLAPSGYNLDSTKRHFKLTFDTNTKTWSAEGTQDVITLIPLEGGPEGNFQTTITNVKGMTLPGTGGMGTTIFKTVGGAVILLACAMLLIYYKKSKKNTQQ